MENSSNSFKHIADKCHADRIAQYQYNKNEFNNIVQKEYSLFRIWCKAYKKGLMTKQNFDEYSQKERKIMPWVKRKLAERYL